MTACGRIAVQTCRARATRAGKRKQDSALASKTVVDKKMMIVQDTAREVSKENSVIMATSEHLKNRLGKYRYVKVPGFSLPAGEGMATSGVAECEMKCTTIGPCKSFSFNRVTNECKWSSNKIQYDDNYVLYIKSKHSVEHFTAVPGMKVAAAGENAVISALNACKLKCAGSEMCFSASYSTETGFCILSGVRVTLGSDYDYFEKVDGIARMKGKQVQMKLRHEKQDVKMQKAMDAYEMGVRASAAHATQLSDDLEGPTRGHDSTALVAELFQELM